MANTVQQKLGKQNELCRLRRENAILRERITIVARMTGSWAREYPTTSQGRYAAIKAALTNSGCPDLVNQDECNCGEEQ